MKCLALVVLFAVSPAYACKEGYVPSDTAGVCIERPTEKTNPAWVSDEKPPKDKMPSYQREGIVVLNPPAGVEPSSESAHDYKAESEGK